MYSDYLPIKQHNGRGVRHFLANNLVKLISVITALSIAVTALTTFMIPPAHASATAVSGSCSGGTLSEWNWKAAAHTADSGFVDGTSSYVMFQRVDDLANGRNIYYIYYSDNTNAPIVLDIVSGSPVITMNSPVQISRIELFDEPQTVPAYKAIWGGSSSSRSAIAMSASLSNQTADSATVSCLQGRTTSTVTSAAWKNGGGFVGYGDLTSGTGSGSSCASLDIACTIKSAFRNVANTFLDVGQAILQGISNFFVPDGTQLKTDFDDFNTWINNKLGFLTYPATFLHDLIQAFNDTSGTCTPTSCVFSFGTFFGSSFSFDLFKPAQTMPTLWTWLKTMIQALTVLEVVLLAKKVVQGSLAR